MASFADIQIRFGADLNQFSSKMQNAQRSLDKASKQFASAGKALSIGLTAPIVALGVSSVVAFDAQAKALAQVESALASTGGVANKTFEELQQLASSQQNNSLFGDEQILKDATAQLLTFTNITNEQFDRTQQAALDLSTRLDGDLKSSAIQLGKALNDPVKGLSALAKSGIQFSDDQKAVINSLAQTGRLAEAQNLILEELEKQYGGAAAVAASAGTGPLKQLSNILGDITEDFGKIIVEAIAPFIAYLKDMALRFQALSPEIKKTIVVITGIAAAIGPVLLGMSAILPLLPAIAAGFAALTGPIGLAVTAAAAIGVVIAENWNPIKTQLIEIANYFIDLYNESSLVRAGVEAVIIQFKLLYEVGKFLFNALVDYVIGFGKTWFDVFNDAGKILKAVLTGNFSEIPSLLDGAFQNVKSNFSSLITDIDSEFNTLNTNLKQIVKDSTEAVSGRKKIELIVESVDATDVTEKTTAAIKKVAPISTSVKAVTSSKSVKKEKKGTESLDTINSSGLASIGGEFQTAEIQVVESTDKMKEAMAEFNTSATASIQDAAQNFATGFGEILAGLVTGQAGIGDIFALLLNTVADVVTQLGAAAIGIGTSMIAIQTAFSNPATAIAAGIALTAIGALIKTAIPSILSGGGGETAFANGGIVYGPTKALVGEYAGARNNPEVIAPLNKLKDYINPTSETGSTVVGGNVTIKGADLQLALVRQNKRKNRRS